MNFSVDNTILKVIMVSKIYYFLIKKMSIGEETHTKFIELVGDQNKL